MSSLFGSRDRTRRTGKKYNESVYGFLNASAWASFQRIREFWDGWFAQYDGERKTALARRFQSLDDHAHLSAFLELFTFAVLKRSGMAIEVEPQIGELALEFLAETNSGQRLFVECTATGQRADEAGPDAREGELLEAIDRIPTGRFILVVTVRKRGPQMPSIRLLTSWLQTWLESLEGEGGEETWEESDWAIHFSAVSADDSESSGRGIGILGPTVTDATDQTARLRRAIDRKASRYGDLQEPLLIVTNSTDYHSDRSLMAVLMGDPIWHVNMKTRDVTETRSGNGIFHDSRGPRNVVMSAVIHGYFGVWAFADRTRSLTLIHHPFTQRPLPRGLFPFCEERHFDPESGDLITTPATITLGEFFDLPAGWPFFDDDDVEEA
jgi:hypothetical protein